MTRLSRNRFSSPVAASLVIGASLLGASALHRTADSAPTQAPAPVNVAFCNVAHVISKLKEYEKEKGMNDLKTREYANRVQETKDQAEKLESDLKENKIPAKDYAARADAMGRLQELKGIFDARKKVYEFQVDLLMSDTVNRLYAKTFDAVAALAKKEGLDIVMLDDRSVRMPQLGSAGLNEIVRTMDNKRVIYAREGLDLTDRVINLMNEQFEAGAGAQPAPALPAPAAPR